MLYREGPQIYLIEKTSRLATKRFTKQRKKLVFVDILTLCLFPLLV